GLTHIPVVSGRGPAQLDRSGRDRAGREIGHRGWRSRPGQLQAPRFAERAQLGRQLRPHAIAARLSTDPSSRRQGEERICPRDEQVPELSSLDLLTYVVAEGARNLGPRQNDSV